MLKPLKAIKKLQASRCANQRRIASSKPAESVWKSVVGLEVHAQIATRTKLFSGSNNQFASPVNTCVSMFDASIPGTLPAGYQITQQRKALANSGHFSFPVFVPGVVKKPYIKTVRLHQLQLEQDSGKSLHDDLTKHSLVDLNRAGVPLMELVFEPDLSDGEEAAALVKELILILLRLGTCSCKMEEGALRVDANVSLHKANTALGTRTEIKNIGSVRGVAQAISYEIERQRAILNKNGTIINETRCWNAVSKRTITMRDKEVQQDYRFMPEPNLTPLYLTIDDSSQNSHLINVLEIKGSLPEMPDETRQILIKHHGVTFEIAIILVNEPRLLEYFLQIRFQKPELQVKLITNILINELLSILNKNKISIDQCTISNQCMANLIEMLNKSDINLYYAKKIIQEMINSPESPQEIALKNGWEQINDDTEIEKLCTDIIASNPATVKQFQLGKSRSLMALAGEVAKKSEQKVNMLKVMDKLKQLLIQFKS